MAKAYSLSIEQPFNSKTDGNTVQYACIDQELTGKCIQYHNDQWFTFTNTNFQQIYINISDQQCRDLRGVQLVVIEGELCQPDTYSILDCISLATQDDIYSTLSGLKPNQKYWLNVDGYLHDYCEFSIEVSPIAKGISTTMVSVLEKTNGLKQKNAIQLLWSITDSLARTLQNFIIMRRESKAFRSDSIDTVPIEFNAFGRYQPDYNFTDQLYEPGTYWYRIIGQTAEGQHLFLEEFSFVIGEHDLSKAVLLLDYEENDDIIIRIYNEENSLLETISFRYKTRNHLNYSLFIDKYKKWGAKSLKIELYNKDNDHRKEFFVELD